MLGNSCSVLFLRERTPQKNFSQHCTQPDQIPGHILKRKINTNGARYLTDAVHKSSVQATFCKVLGQTGTCLPGSSKPAGQLLRGTSPSKTFVVINWGMGLQDALRILLHQRAPAHLPCQEQILAVHGVQVLNLQPGEQEAGRGTG